MKKKINTLDLYLIVSLAVLLLYTISVLVIFWLTGQEPGVLTGSVFAAFGGEVFLCAWIKKLKLNKEFKELHGCNDEEPCKEGSDEAFG